MLLTTTPTEETTMTTETIDPRITPDDIEIGDWTEDGETYRAAYIGEVRLTGPEHAHLSDDALTAEAVTEAYRGGLFAPVYHIEVEIGDGTPREWRPLKDRTYDTLADAGLAISHSRRDAALALSAQRVVDAAGRVYGVDEVQAAVERRRKRKELLGY